MTLSDVEETAARAAALSARLEGAEPLEILEAVIHGAFPERVALVSSFGAESVVLLHLAARVEPALPVIFIDTEKHFAQTRQYRDELVERLGLRDFRSVAPDPHEVAAEDPGGDLWRRDADACCTLRKVRPNQRALAGFDAWISGRKRHHGGVRAALPSVEHDGAHFKVNPLAAWGPKDITAYIRAHDLPPHPLVAQGYPSIGCWPCTAPADAAGDIRAGRWAGQGKTECGIHRPAAAKRQQAF